MWWSSKKIEVEKDVEDVQVVEDDGFRMNMNCKSALMNYFWISFLLSMPLLISWSLVSIMLFQSDFIQDIYYMKINRAIWSSFAIYLWPQPFIIAIFKLSLSVMFSDAFLIMSCFFGIL